MREHRHKIMKIGFKPPGGGAILCRLHQLVRDRKQRQLKPRRNARLVEDIRQMPLNRFLAERELLGDIPVAASLDNAPDDL